jgi:O-acetyl-ADP-ribose deacetylase (regulator of RNase III)
MEIQLIRADITSIKVDAMVNPVQSPFDDTPGGNLLCRFIVHVPSPPQGDEDALRASTQQALERAEELAVGSVAMPAFWTAPADASRCARIMLQTTLGFRDRARSLRRVVYTLFGQPSYETFERTLKEVDR